MNLSITYKIDRLLGFFGSCILKLFPTERTGIRPDTPQLITVVKFLGGGSLTLAAPALLALKKRYPTAQFMLLTTPAVRANAELLGIYDRIICISPKQPLAAWKIFHALKKELKNTVSILLDFELYSAFTHVLTAWLSASYSIGLGLPGKKYLWDETFVVENNTLMHDAYDRTVQLAGAVPLKDHPQKFWGCAPENRQKTLIAAPFCSALSLRREWDFRKWAEFLNRFLAQNSDFSVIIPGAPDDRAQAQQLISNVAEPYRNRIENWCGSADFKTSFAAIRRAALFVGIDSAPLHLARLSGTPAVSLWGPTDPRSLARPFADYPEVILFAKHPCTPCVHKNGHPCPLGKSCTAAIPPEQVLHYTVELLAGRISDSTLVTLNDKENSK